MNERPERAARGGSRKTSTGLLASLVFGALVGLFVARDALAAKRPYVTVHGDPSDPVVLRVVPELLALGCVVRIDASPTTDPATFVDGDAVVRVTATTVTFWLLDPRNGRATETGTVGIDDRGRDAIDLTAVRVSEIVRAQLLRADPGPAPSLGVIQTAPPGTDAGASDAARDAAPEEHAPETTGPGAAAPAARSRREALPAVAPVAARTPPHLSADLGPVLLLAPGGTKPALDLALSPAWHPSRSLQVRALLAAPLTTPSVIATGGEAAVSTWLGGAAVDWQVSSSDDGWRGTLGAGAAAVVSHSQGTATAPYVASSSSAVTALTFVEMGGSRGLGTAQVRIGVRGMLGVALPEIVVQFAALRAATWGLPVVAAVSATLDVDIL
jgi:hypothetical protein